MIDETGARHMRGEIYRAEQELAAANAENKRLRDALTKLGYYTIVDYADQAQLRAALREDIDRALSYRIVVLPWTGEEPNE